MTFATHPHRNSLLIVAVVVLVVIWAGCSKLPSVLHTSVSGNVRAVQNWKLIWADSLAWAPNLNQSGRGSMNEKQLEAYTYCQKYIEQTKRELKTKYDFNFYENVVVTGHLYIRIFPRGHKVSMAVPDSTSERWIQRRMEPGGMNNGWGAWNVARGMFSLLTGRDLIIGGVNVILTDPNDKPFANVSMSKYSGAGVKPKFVAEVLDELVSTGDYVEPTPGAKKKRHK